MSANTNIESAGLVTFSIKVDGKTIPDAMDVKTIEIEKGINRISTAKISIIDGEASSGEFEASSSNDFVPGNEVSIEVGYDSHDTSEGKTSLAPLETSVFGVF